MRNQPAKSDAATYCRMARNIARFGTFSNAEATSAEKTNPTAYTMPGYPLLLSPLFLISGSEPPPIATIRFLQILFSLGLIILAYNFGILLYNRWAGVASALITALYPGNIFSTQVILTECLFTIFFVSGIYFYLSALKRAWGEKGRYREAGFAGFCIMVTFAIRPTILVFIPFMAAFLIWEFLRNKPHPSHRRLLAHLTLLLAPFLLFWGIWIIRNAVQFHHFIPLSTEGNNVKLVGFDIMNKYIPRMHTIPGGEYEANRVKGEWASAALKENLKVRPAMFFKVMLRKVIPLLTIPFGIPESDGWEEMTWQWEYWLHRAHRFLFWFALLGLLLLLPQKKEIGLVLLLVLLFTFTHIVYIGINRYGYPLIALLLNFAGVAVVRLVEGLKTLWDKGAWKRYAGISSIVAAFLLLIFRCHYMFPGFQRYYFTGELIVAAIAIFWIYFMFAEQWGWDGKIKVTVVLLVFMLNYWGLVSNFRVWGITPDRIFSYGYLYSNNDVIEQIIDIPENIKSCERYHLSIRSKRGSSEKPTYVYQIFANGQLLKEIQPSEPVPQILSIDLPPDLVRKNALLRVSLKLKGNVDVYKQYLLVDLRLDRFRGVSLFDGQADDLSYRKRQQQGTFEIALIASMGVKEIVWYGSPRKELLTQLQRVK
jgi:4-amino-4-deoxy-L-arabinose transferase-like glycosyltransferase